MPTPMQTRQLLMATRKGKTMDTKKSGKETKEKAQKKKKETKEKAQKKKEEKETKEKAQKNNCKMMSTMRTHMAAVLNYGPALRFDHKLIMRFVVCR